MVICQCRDMFISYAPEDLAAALRLYEDLKPRTNETFMISAVAIIMMPGHAYRLYRILRKLLHSFL